MPKLEMLELDKLDANLGESISSLNDVYYKDSKQIKGAINTVTAYNSQAVFSPDNSEPFFLASEAAKAMSSSRESIYPLDSFQSMIPVTVGDIKSLYVAINDSPFLIPTKEEEKNTCFADAPALLCAAATSYVGLRAALSIASRGSSQANNGVQMPAHIGNVFKELAKANDQLQFFIDHVAKPNLADNNLSPLELEHIKDKSKLLTTVQNASDSMRKLQDQLEPVVQSHLDFKISGLGQVETIKALEQVNTQQAQESVKILH